MPLDKGCSMDAFQSNVRASYKEGKTAKGTQHVAIAISTLKRACGVSDGGKMTPKEIVAAGSKDEGHHVRLGALLDRGPLPEVSDGWFGAVAEAATAAVREAERGKRGPATEQLLALIHALVGKRVPAPTFESLHPGADDWGPWRGWVGRVMYAAENVAVPELAALVRAYVRGQTRVPVRAGLSERVSRGIDFAVRSSAHGAATSPSSAPPEANSGANAGTFKVFADDGEIKSGDGRAPKKRSKR